MNVQLDELDRLAASVFDGYLVRNGLGPQIRTQYPVPTHVVEFLLGRYCASVIEDEIAEGLTIVEKQLKDRTVRTGDEETVQGIAPRKLAMSVSSTSFRARVDAGKTIVDVAELPSLALRDVRIGDQLVRDNERMLTDGFYAEVTLTYDGIIARKRRPAVRHRVASPSKMSKPDVLDQYARGRRVFGTQQWIEFLLRSIGLEPQTLNETSKTGGTLADGAVRGSETTI